MRVRRPIRSTFVPIAALALMLPLLIAASGGQRVPVVVTFSSQVADARATAQEMADRHGFELDHVYEHALLGFAAEVPERAVDGLDRDGRTAIVEPDVAEHITAQSIPTGIDRIETDLVPAADIDNDGSTVPYHVAIIDTGLDPDHEDLNVAGGRNFTSLLASAWADDNGHGSHVGGTVGASDNNLGVVGVAPGANLWAVKVCGSLGVCLTSDIVAGIDWVAEQKSSGNIDFAVANMSISSQDSSNGCSDPNDSVHAAICGVVNQGVVFALAAGNSGEEKQAYPVAFSVSAIADFDGLAGAAGSPTCRDDQDDTLADFSNYGDSIDIAAPGVCIRSAWWDGSYHTISGTSMATPHVAGAVALYLHANGQAPAQDASGVSSIEDAILSAALPQGTTNQACSYDDARPGGPLLFVNAAEFGGDGSCETADGSGGGGGDGGSGDGGLILHVHDLDATGAGANGPNWDATVTITVTDADENPVEGATVSGSWDDGTGVSCTTGTDGTCEISTRFNSRKKTSATFSVTGVSRSGDSYDEPTNHDADGDSYDSDGSGGIDSIDVSAP